MKIATSNLVKKGLRIIIEPGNALVRNSVLYESKIIAKKIIENEVFLTIDGTLNHISPNSKLQKVQYRLLSANRNTVRKQIIVGNTCKESDIFIVLEDEICLDIGDHIQFLNMGAYISNAQASNIIPIPNIEYHPSKKLSKSYSTHIE